jgi:DNA-directed RNA polymerase specialized sigma24 family protein
VVVLHLYAGYTLADTAEILGIPQETARSRMRVARDHLRGALAGGPQ